MEKNIQNKKDPKVALRKALFPIGLITGIVGFVWMIIQFTFGYQLIEASSAKLVADLMDADRYIAIVFAFLSLVVFALLTSISILHLVKMTKNKHEIMLGIANATVSLLLLVFFILICTKMFSENDWFTEMSRKSSAYVGIIFSLVVYATIYSAVDNSKKTAIKGGNEAFIRTVSISAFVLALLSTLPALLIFAGYSSSGDEILAKVKFASLYLIKFAVAIFGTVAISLLSTIAAIVLNKEHKKMIIKYSIISGISFIFFVIIAAMSAMNYDGKGAFFTNNPETYSVFMLFSWIATLVTGILAFVWTKNKKAIKPVVAKKAHK